MNSTKQNTLEQLELINGEMKQLRERMHYLAIAKKKLRLQMYGIPKKYRTAEKKNRISENDALRAKARLHWQRWDTTDELFALQNRGKAKTKDIADYLGRTRNAVASFFKKIDRAEQEYRRAGK